MGYIPNIISADTVTFFLKGTPYSVDKSFHGFLQVIEQLKSSTPDENILIAATQPIQAIRNAVERAENIVDPETGLDYLPKGVVSVTRSEVKFNGVNVTGVLVDRILSLLAEGFDIMPMIRFLENLYQNPADFAREELYLWLENNNLPITEDGHFLAYKTVRSDFKSHHDGRTDNTPGVTVSMPRQNVDPVRDRTCSRGLHFCSHSYLSNFGSGGVIVILKVNPADVVSIPSDYNNAKGRAWKYDVLSVFGEDPHAKVWPSVVSPTGGDVIKPIDPADEPLVIGSDLARALFAACNEIGLTERYVRFRWAAKVLDSGMVQSFNDLTQGDASELLKAARARKVELDAIIEANATLVKTRAEFVAKEARQAEVSAIGSYGIETLRRMASAARYSAATGKSPYKEARKSELIAFLISKIGK